MFDDEPRAAKPEIVLGEKLDDHSVGDLEDRIAALREEIARVEQELTNKKKGLSAAEAVFGKQ